MQTICMMHFFSFHLHGYMAVVIRLFQIRGPLEHNPCFITCIQMCSQTMIRDEQYITITRCCDIKQVTCCRLFLLLFLHYKNMIKSVNKIPCNLDWFINLASVFKTINLDWSHPKFDFSCYANNLFWSLRFHALLRC